MAVYYSIVSIHHTNYICGHSITHQTDGVGDQNGGNKNTSHRCIFHISRLLASEQYIPESDFSREVLSFDGLKQLMLDMKFFVRATSQFLTQDTQHNCQKILKKAIQHVTKYTFY